MRKWLVLTFIVALLALSACGNEEAAKEDSGNKDGEITVWAMGEEGKLLKQLTDKFEKDNEGIKVDVQAIPWDSAHDKLLTAVASGNGPDILQLGTTWVPEFAEAGALLDLTEYMEEHPEFAAENYFDGAAEIMQYDDQIVGIPWYVDTRVLYYRTDILEEAGYDKAPETWEELQDAAKKLADRGEGQYGIDIDQNDQIMPFIFAWQNGYEANLEESKLNFDTPEFLGAMEYYTSFFKERSSQVEQGEDIVQAFANGKKPMFFSGPWMVNIINEQAPDIEGKWAPAVMPGNETNASSMGGATLSIFHNSENVENALKFLSYMNETETQLEWLDISNTLPSKLESWEDPILQDDPMYSVFGEQLKEAKAGLQTEQFERIAQELLSALERVNAGGADLEKEIEQFNKTAQDLLEE
ncbi:MULTISPECIES: sugar ABC transporter substrate-binding protein [Virgibacillus]|uniref:Cyclodextrin-binding protein n=1 Tax=Virgibacillus dokdonensis TaxID=302167 RepID=A0A2K9J279_9BACI|nr:MULTISPECIES: sugar ABC transporter substrate-binding protein [Virgibacillus]AUJ24111.1 Cyclodextrin-binding protein precursor [Virgibacillus dokdonensis]NWO13542.1 sugar ABC transporter substrate-binding protein [Virgibacillus sp.]